MYKRQSEEKIERYNGRNWHGSKAPQYGVSDLERLIERKKGDRLLNAAAQFNEPPGFSRNCFRWLLNLPRFATILIIIRNVQNYYLEDRPG